VRVLRLAFRNLARNRRRTLLTGGVVVFGFASFALAGGFMAQSLEGLRDGTIRSGLGHLQIGDPQAFEPGSDGTLEHALGDADKVAELARADRDVAEVLPRIDFVGLLTDGTRSVPFLGVGLDHAAEARAMDQAKTLRAGRWLTGPADHAVVLGGGLARSLRLQAGDAVTLMATTADGTLNALDAEVAGVVDIPIRELDDRFLATSIGLAADLVSAGDRVSKLVVVLREGCDTVAVSRRLQQGLAAQGSGAIVKRWEDLAPFYRQVRLLYAGIFGFMGIVLVVVVLLATANTMLMAAAERTREIGTLRALGTRPASVRRLFLLEGLLLAAAGCAAGAIVSLVLRGILNHSGIMLPPPPGATHGMPLHVKIYGVAYGAGALAMLATLAAASWLPARRASRLPIVEALTHV
jgi:putative ABC transport system permease protein